MKILIDKVYDNSYKPVGVGVIEIDSKGLFAIIQITGDRNITLELRLSKCLEDETEKAKLIRYIEEIKSYLQIHDFKIDTDNVFINFNTVIEKVY